MIILIIIVVAATNRPDMLDAALIRPGRIDRKIYVPPPDDLSREQIISNELKKMPTSNGIDISELVNKSNGFSGAEVVACVSEAALIAIDDEDDFITHQHLLKAINGIKPQITQSMLLFYDQLKKQYSFGGK
jgi:ATP-dependent 26S proteasome regulatory subunit